MSIIQATRKTRLGFGYTSACEQTERGLRVCKVKKPDYFGTILQLQKQIAEDKTLASWRGSTYYNTAWFAKVNGKWVEIKWEYPTVFDLTEKTPEGNYLVDSVELETTEGTLR